MRIAIAGNPNSGKTTFFNALSGRNERVGNWSGVTVEKKESPLRRKYNPLQEERIMLVDLPGAYSMDAYTNDELEATDFLKNENIDVIINVVDAANLERSLHLSLELIETGIPVVIALNKEDIVKRRMMRIRTNKLSHILGVPVLFTQATSSRGLYEVLRAAVELVDSKGIMTDENRRQKQANQGYNRRGCGKGYGFHHHHKD